MNRSLRILLIVLVLVVIICVAWVFLFPRGRGSTILTSSNPLYTPTFQMELAIPTQALNPTASPMFEIPTLNALATKASKTKSIKPTLQFQSFSTGTPFPTRWACPPEGMPSSSEGKLDEETNKLKNRTNEADKYYPISFDEIIPLPPPHNVSIGKERENWSTNPDYSILATQVSTYEGLPVSLEGYMNEVIESGPETAECNIPRTTDPTMVDWHIILTKIKYPHNPNDPNHPNARRKGVIVETTRGVRALHQWDFKVLQVAAKGDLFVRISGWLFFDQEHPAMITQGQRATLWEIHPIMQIEIQWPKDSKWYPLDKCKLDENNTLLCQK